MEEPFIGEIRIFANSFAPMDWARCDGQLLTIAENTALYSIIGTTYGGDGRVNFALPNLQERVPLGVGEGQSLTNRELGEDGGQAEVELNQNQMPSHNHMITNVHVDRAEQQNPEADTYLGKMGGNKIYGPADKNLEAMHLDTLSLSGQSQVQAHENRQPFLTLQFCIALKGIFPPRSY